MAFWQDILSTVSLLYLWNCTFCFGTFLSHFSCSCRWGWSSAVPRLITSSLYYHSRSQSQRPKSVPWTTEQQNEVINPREKEAVTDIFFFFFSCKSVKPHFTKTWDQILISISSKAPQCDWDQNLASKNRKLGEVIFSALGCRLQALKLQFTNNYSKTTLNIVICGTKRGLTTLKFLEKLRSENTSFFWFSFE